MTTYRPKIKKPDTSKLVMVITTKEPSFYRDYEHAHVRLYLASVEARYTDRRFPENVFGIGSDWNCVEYLPYQDSNCPAIHRHKDHFYDELWLSAQIGNDDYEGLHQSHGAYAWAAEYREVYSVDYQKAEQMTATLKRIENAYEGYKKKHGTPKTFGDFCLAHANILNIPAFVYRKSKDDNYRTYNPAEASALIDQLAREMWLKFPKAQRFAA